MGVIETITRVIPCLLAGLAAYIAVMMWWPPRKAPWLAIALYWTGVAAYWIGRSLA